MAHVATITIDYTKVPGDLTDYVGLIVPDGSAGYSALYALCLEGGGDIRLFKSDDSTELAREIVSFSVSAETGEIHYKYSGTLSSSVDTDIHVYADGSSSDYATTATYGAEAVWGGYALVSHNGGAEDSTGNNSFSSFGGVTSGGVTGKIGDATSYDGLNDYIKTTGNVAVDNLTLSVWVKTNSSKNFGGIVCVESGVVTSMFQFVTSDTGDIQFQSGDGEADMKTWLGDSFNNNVWRHSVITIGSGDTDPLMYLDGTGTSVNLRVPAYQIDPTNYAFSSLNKPLLFGAERTKGVFGVFSMGEVRLRDSVQTANWITTEYNNQNDEAAFWGTWTDAGGGGSTPAQAARRGAVMMM